MHAEAPEIEAVFRREHGRVFSHLLAAFGDFDVVGDAIQDAYVRALERWPQDGVPARPGAWITTVAKNRVRSERRHHDVVRRTRGEAAQAQPELFVVDDDVPDQRARLLFTCCHPALAEPARLALTLHTVCGLPTPTIARLFLVADATVAQRLVRAKKKIRAAAIPFEVPHADRLAARIDDVLSCIYLTFTAGYAALEGPAFVSGELCREAIRLARVMSHAFPRHAQARALLALALLHHARYGARHDDHGLAVALQDQHQRAWDQALVDEGVATLDEALAVGARGPYALQASIAALHTQPVTDWPQIAGLYKQLVTLNPSPAAFVAFAVAESMAEGPHVGLATLSRAVNAGHVHPDFDRLPAARADILRRASRFDEAAAEYATAIGLARQPSERSFLQRRLVEVVAQRDGR